jgi:N-carbamoylputrescine amidase
MAKVTIGLLQHACGADPAANLKKTLSLAKEAAKRGANIICTQELFRSQYFCQSEDHANFKLAEKIPGPSTQAFQKFAKKHGVVVIASLFEKRASGLYHNTAVVIDADGSLLGIYRKMHIPDDPLYYEKFYFTPGDTGFRSWKTKFGKIGVLICWDQWYPEAARLTALQGPRSSSTRRRSAGTRRREEEARREPALSMGDDPALARGRQRLLCRRVQPHRPRDPHRRPGIEFWGQSFIAGTSGQILAKAKSNKEEILLVPVSLGEVDTTRTHWPFLRDRRIDAYGDMTKRFRD